MIEVTGAYNTAKCFCRTLEDTARQQIQSVCDQPAFAGSRIRIMPDVHAGMGCTIGTTMTITDRLVPGMVGVDIGCGMETVRLAERTLDLDRLDRVIRTHIPAGREIRSTPHPLCQQLDLTALRCASRVSLDRARRSIGTLGGGNHFIEIDRGSDGALYLVVHSGSRHLGKQAAMLYQDEGRRAMWGGAQHQIEATIAALKAAGRTREIQPTVSRLRREHRLTIPRELAYVEGRLFDDYLHDMKLIQRFAVLNRRAITDVILTQLGLTPVEAFTTIHNYIDTDAMILRKGSVSARAGERLLIPINMRDGSLICIGRGDPDWNFSAPHGAGRLMSRSQAQQSLSLAQFRAEMAGIYSTCVSQSTLDESPMAYKCMDEIVSELAPTAEIVERILPIYNFKAAD